MTIEEAIDYLMPIYENAQLNGYKVALGTVLAAARDQQPANYRQVGKALQDNGFESLEQFLAAYQQIKSIQQEAEKNEPLTLEELKKMDGQPVYVRRQGYRGHWALVYAFGGPKGIIYLTYSDRATNLAEFVLNNRVEIYRRRAKRHNHGSIKHRL